MKAAIQSQFVSLVEISLKITKILILKLGFILYSVSDFHSVLSAKLFNQTL